VCSHRLLSTGVKRRKKYKLSWDIDLLPVICSKNIERYNVEEANNT